MSRYNIAMNYNTNIKHTYTLSDTLTNNGTAILFGSDGNSHYVSDVNPNYNNGSPFEETLGYYANYFNRNYSSDSNSDLIGVAYMDDRGIITLFVNNKIDFLQFSVSGNNSVEVSCVNYKHNNGYYVIEDGSLYRGYIRYDGDDSSATKYDEYTYGSYDVTINSVTPHSVFDFSSTENGNNYRTHSLAIRGESMAFYDYGFELLGNIDYLTISYGTPYYDIENSAYERGYGNGTNTGFVNGYDVGYNDGLIAGGTDGNTANAFNYLSKAFQCVSGILAIEVLPHITLGLCFSIPLTLVLVMTIFKMVKK